MKRNRSAKWRTLFIFSLAGLSCVSISSADEEDSTTLATIVSSQSPRQAKLDDIYPFNTQSQDTTEGSVPNLTPMLVPSLPLNIDVDVNANATTNENSNQPQMITTGLENLNPDVPVSEFHFLLPNFNQHVFKVTRFNLNSMGGKIPNQPLLENQSPLVNHPSQSNNTYFTNGGIQSESNIPSQTNRSQFLLEVINTHPRFHQELQQQIISPVQMNSQQQIPLQLPQEVPQQLSQQHSQQLLQQHSQQLSQQNSQQLSQKISQKLHQKPPQQLLQYLLQQKHQQQRNQLPLLQQNNKQQTRQKQQHKQQLPQQQHILQPHNQQMPQQQHILQQPKQQIPQQQHILQQPKQQFSQQQHILQQQKQQIPQQQQIVHPQKQQIPQQQQIVHPQKQQIPQQQQIVQPQKQQFSQQQQNLQQQYEILQNPQQQIIPELEPKHISSLKYKRPQDTYTVDYIDEETLPQPQQTQTVRLHDKVPSQETQTNVHQRKLHRRPQSSQRRPSKNRLQHQHQQSQEYKVQPQLFKNQGSQTTGAYNGWEDDMENQIEGINQLPKQYHKHLLQLIRNFQQEHQSSSERKRKHKPHRQHQLQQHHRNNGISVVHLNPDLQSHKKPANQLFSHEQFTKLNMKNADDDNTDDYIEIEEDIAEQTIQHESTSHSQRRPVYAPPSYSFQQKNPKSRRPSSQPNQIHAQNKHQSQSGGYGYSPPPQVYQVTPTQRPLAAQGLNHWPTQVRQQTEETQVSQWPTQDQDQYQDRDSERDVTTQEPQYETFDPEYPTPEPQYETYDVHYPVQEIQSQYQNYEAQSPPKEVQTAPANEWPMQQSQRQPAHVYQRPTQAPVEFDVDQIFQQPQQQNQIGQRPQQQNQIGQRPQQQNQIGQRPQQQNQIAQQPHQYQVVEGPQTDQLQSYYNPTTMYPQNIEFTTPPNTPLNLVSSETLPGSQERIRNLLDSIKKIKSDREAEKKKQEQEAASISSAETTNNNNNSTTTSKAKDKAKKRYKLKFEFVLVDPDDLDELEEDSKPVVVAPGKKS